MAVGIGQVGPNTGTGSGGSGYSGTSGYSGYSGTGTSGYSGYSGISGYSGFSGVSGYSGFSGKSGFSGVAPTATIQVSMLGPNTIPDSSGDCWGEPFSILATNDVWPFIIWRFGAANDAAPTTRIGLYGQFTVPQNYVGTLSIIPIWTATLTSGDVVWDFDYRTVGGNDTTSLDQSGTEESVSVTDTAPGAAYRRLTPGLSPTSANFAAGETVEFGIFRDGTDGADTMAGSAMLVDLIFQYANA